MFIFLDKIPYFMVKNKAHMRNGEVPSWIKCTFQQPLLELARREEIKEHHRNSFQSSVSKATMYLLGLKDLIPHAQIQRITDRDTDTISMRWENPDMVRGFGIIYCKGDPVVIINANANRDEQKEGLTVRHYTDEITRVSDPVYLAMHIEGIIAQTVEHLTGLTPDDLQNSFVIPSLNHR